MFLRKDILKICSKLTGEHPCRSAISIKLYSNFIEIALRHGCSVVNLLQTFRTSFLKNTSGWLRLTNQGFYITSTECKASKYGVFSVPYFPVFGLNTEIYGINLRIQCKYRKIRTRKNSAFGQFIRSVHWYTITPDLKVINNNVNLLGGEAEAATRSVLSIKLFLKISQYSHLAIICSCRFYEKTHQ